MKQSTDIAPRFRVVDRPTRKSTVVAGVIHIGDLDRDIVEEFGFIEPADVSVDEFVSVPIRSALTYGAPSFEIGPFDLDPSDCIALYKALGRHLTNFRFARFVDAGDPA